MNPFKTWFRFPKFGMAEGHPGPSVAHLRLVSSNKGANDEACELSSRARFPVSQALLDRQIAARGALPANSIKRLIEEQPEIMDPPRWPPDAA